MLLKTQVQTGYIAALKSEYRARKLRKAGQDARVIVTVAPPRVKVPIYNMSTGLLNTVEGGVLYNRLPREIYNTVKAGYDSVENPTRHAMLFSAKRGEYKARAEWWKVFLRGVLSPEEANCAMIYLLRWYRRNISGERTGIYKEISCFI